MHLYYHNHLSVPTDDLSTDCAWWYSAQGAWGALAGHNNEVNPTRSTSPSHALFGVTLPCPGKCWACKTELSIIQHEQEDVWSDMGGGQGPTKPRADRGYHFDVSVWACRVEQGAVGNLLEHPAPPPTTTSNTTTTTPSFSLPLPPDADPLCTLYVLLHFPLWHAHSLSRSISASHIHKRTHTHTLVQYMHTDMKARSLCLLTKQELAALVTDNKVVNGWFWRK